MVFTAKQEVQRHHAGLWRQSRSVGRRADAELNVARLNELKDLRLLTKLGAGILVDQHRAFTQFLELVREQITGDAVSGGLGLVVGETKMLYLLRRRS